MNRDQDEFVPSTARMPSGGSGKNEGRPWLGVRFLCAGAYLRIYRNRSGTGYIATCPRCGKHIRFDVGPGGTSQRFFDVSC